jgi:hypothetical protein
MYDSRGKLEMAKPKAKQYFLKHEQMDFELQAILGECVYGAGDCGEVLAAVDMIKSGDCESWYQAWVTTAERVEGFAKESAAKGNDVSAREAYLRAAAYFAASISMIDGTDDPSRAEPAWQRHQECFAEFGARLSPPMEQFSIPYEDTPMPGYFFVPDDSGGPFPTVIFNNGSDGPTSMMWVGGIAGALRRGYAAFTFDGPGQNGMLFLHNVPFRHDWEKVITPIVDVLAAREEVDEGRIALSGISQGGYWVLRALAFEKRIKAGICDPAVMDVSAAILSKFPKRFEKLLDQGNKEEFDKEMNMGMKMMGHEMRQAMVWRMKPYQTDSFYEWVSESMKFNARDVIKQIECPMFIADPEDEQFWPGQSQEVFDALECPKTLVKFTAEEGANWHCEPRARSLYDQRMFDWLATVI